jgi:hypothetical protein
VAIRDKVQQDQILNKNEEKARIEMSRIMVTKRRLTERNG